MRKIDGLADIEREIQEGRSRLEQFREPSNLSQCALLAKTYTEQSTILALAFGLGQKAAENARKELHAAIKAQFDGNDFKVP